MAPVAITIVRFMEFGVLGPLRVVEHDKALPWVARSSGLSWPC